jgi:hypothetical protein
MLDINWLTERLLKSWGLLWVMKKALRQLFLGKDASISPRTMQPISSPGEKMALAMGPIITIQARSTVINRPIIPSARVGLIFSSGRVLNKNYLIGVWLNLDGIFPLKGSQEDHWRGKISWKCHFQAKANSILLENCLRGFHEGAVFR